LISLNIDIQNRIEATTLSLYDYCRKNNWAGYDPYDALNSRLFARTPFSRSRICRIAVTQAMKRLPINLRPLLLISKEQNPKALALFLMALLKLSRRGCGQDGLIRMMVDGSWPSGHKIPVLVLGAVSLANADNTGSAGCAESVCTTFVANALLDAHEYNGDAQCLRMAAVREYILNELCGLRRLNCLFQLPLFANTRP
jgi:hypothetical protein